MPLSRKDFVNICTQAISYTRSQLTINNQLSGYKKFHREIKENHYFSRNVRAPIMDTHEDEYMYRHDLLKHTGLGNCHELADFLLVEIGKEIEQHGALARIRIVNSIKIDHVYLEIKIKLQDECDYSLWEVDAWDPRIIDISTRPNGSIKNHESLDYGYSVNTENSVYSDEIDYQRKHRFFGSIPTPREGRPLRAATPERDMLDKHDHLYRDYTIEDSRDEGKIPSFNKLNYLQKASSWQL
ncbi:hypothetical protein Lnau_1308 [Legionella nautarum]|uniref:Uncharacterized protein n=1 Tax=Legionella nautarum TaxID=45070 RepID=A0A0W0WVM5_9GAMM|nr:hypothetical protein [Legionella nautarum]KTD36324.1 hypothetical protein Lnau_1308 [Legionella nautarum]